MIFIGILLFLQKNIKKMTKTIISKDKIYLYFAIEDKTITVCRESYFNNFNFYLEIEDFDMKIVNFVNTRYSVKTYQNDKNNY